MFDLGYVSKTQYTESVHCSEFRRYNPHVRNSDLYYSQTARFYRSMSKTHHDQPSGKFSNSFNLANNFRFCKRIVNWVLTSYTKYFSNSSNPQTSAAQVRVRTTNYNSARFTTATPVPVEN